MQLIHLFKGLTYPATSKSMRTTRISLCLFFSLIFQLQAGNSYSQEAEIRLSIKDMAIEQALDKIEAETGYTFLYTNHTIDAHRKVNLDVQARDIREVLHMLFSSTDIRYRIVDKQIILSRGAMPASPDVQQSRRITGLVTDTNNEPVIGANVMAKGTTTGSITDIDGRFTLDVPEGAVLQISYIGYISKEVALRGESSLQIRLEEDTKAIDEVVVIGYGAIRKSDLTGSVAVLKSDAISIGTSNSPDQALRGKTTGIQISATSGQPGSGAIVRVRGTSSILGANTPLYVIDGIPVSGGDAAEGLSGKSISPLTTIAPSDIESMEILKDASATAIYGSRGANGVIMITTKQGKYGSQFSANANIVLGFQQVEHMIELTSPQQWTEMWNESMDYKNFGKGKYDINNLPAQTDWQKEIFRTAPIQRYEVSFNGGTEKLRYMLSGSYTTQDGVIMYTDFKRYTMRANIENTALKWLTIGAHVSATRTDSHQAEDGTINSNTPVAQIILAAPVKPIYKEDGSYELYSDVEGRRENPYASIKEIINNDVRNRFTSNAYADVTFIPELKLHTNFAVDYTNANAYNYTPSYIAQGMAVKGSAIVGARNQMYWNWTNTLTYMKTFAQIHNLTGMVGAETQRNIVNQSRSRGIGFANDNSKFYNLSEASTYTASSGYSEWSMESYFARIIYSLMDKYTLTVTGRIDGSSRFGANNKYGSFPSAAFAWRIKEEGFMKNIETLSNLTLRMSYGISGEQGIPQYQTLSTLTVSSVWMNEALYAGYYPSRSADPNLRWEKTYQTNIGIDAGFFNNRLNLTLDYYYKQTKDLLYRKALPPTSGFLSMLKNIGAIENKGFEAAIDAYIVDNKNFKWNVNINNSWNRNKVLELGDGRYEIINPGDGVSGDDVKSWPSILRVGAPLGVLYGYVSNGVIYDEAEAKVAEEMGQVLPFPGELKIVDLNKDGKITDSDKDIIADSNPNFTGGITNSFTYKNIQLNVLCQWVYGNDIMSYQHLNSQRLTLGYNTMKDWYDTRWRVDKPSKVEPRAGYDMRAYTDVSYHVFDGSFLRINNVSLSYSLSKRLLAKFQMHSLKLTAMIDNLYTFTKY
ncbi:MAG: TonB-dependent receptor, partial [Tannerellaceae bacterium]|nr:TonB-dependent receptor [Tannerellaceae bacterium]